MFGHGRRAAARSLPAAVPFAIAVILLSSAPMALSAGPTITLFPAEIVVGDSFQITGTGFTKGSVVNFFVATAAGPVNYGPFTPSEKTATTLIVDVPVTVALANGVVSVRVVNTDEGFIQSDAVTAQLFGDPRDGFPNLTEINDTDLAATSTDPSIALDYVETVILQDHNVTLSGNGFDTVHGVAIDLFCDCIGGKMPTVFLKPGDPGLSATALAFTLPSRVGTGPGSFVVSNRGAKGDYAIKSNAVSVPIGAAVTVSDVKQDGCTVTVSGTGYAVSGPGLPNLTVINLFNQQGTGAVNLGGLSLGGSPNIPLDVSSSTQFSFTMPPGIVSGPAYVQVINPPFVPFTSSGDSLAGAFTAVNCTAPTSIPTETPTHTPTSTPTPTRQPTPTMTAKPTVIPTATAKPTPTQTPVPPAAIWPMFHHDLRHTGLSQFDTSADTGALKWKIDVGGAFSPAVGADGTIYAGLAGINPDGTFKFGPGGVPGTASGGYTVDTSPAVGADGTIYVASGGTLYALDPYGRGKWQFSPTESPLGNTSSPVVAPDGTIYVGSGGPNPTNPNIYDLYAVNPDGSQKWKFSQPAADLSSPAVGADGTIYIVSADDTIYAINPDGSGTGDFACASPFGDPPSSPALGSDGTIYVGVGISFPVDGLGGGLCATIPYQSQWLFSTGMYAVFSSPAVGADGTVYFGGGTYGPNNTYSDPNLYALNPDGSLKWQFETGSYIWSSPAVGADGTIYVGSHDGSLYAVNPDGSVKWTFKTGGAVESSPAVGADGTIYVGSDDGYLYAIH